MALVDKLGESLDRSQGSVILTSLDAVMDWARGKSLWAMPMGTACCAMELIAGSFNKFDFDRHGTFPRPDPRHTDVMVVAGTITRKMMPAVRRLYEQMPDPKWVIAMGNCAVSGGIFYYDTYSVIRGIDEFLPVDVYIAGCPPRPEALQDAVLILREKIATESIVPGKRREGTFTLPTSGDVTMVRPSGQLAPEVPTASVAAEPTEGEGA
ncbi:MAG: NADH-quinone oxidoreductase subunit B [Actinobacteria bacterium]|nr:NADH-quinone oxidoreductase subunit B [Actinomycetota bacterium]